MKIVRLDRNVVAEIIPDYALPVGKWYGLQFATRCVTAPDDVKEGMLFVPATNEFIENPFDPTPTTEERVIELENTIVSLEDAICEMDEANEERMAAIEDALCEMDMG